MTLTSSGRSESVTPCYLLGFGLSCGGFWFGFGFFFFLQILSFHETVWVFLLSVSHQERVTCSVELNSVLAAGGISCSVHVLRRV